LPPRLEGIGPSTSLWIRRYKRPSTLALLAFIVVAPLLAASSLGGHYTWSQLLGLEPGGGVAAGFNVFSWSWLLAILLGVGMFAGDLSDGLVAYVLSKPVTREAYVVSKITVAAVLLAIIYLASAAVSMAAAAVSGSSYTLSAILYAVLYAVSSMPLVLASALLGFLLRSVGRAFAAAVVGWVVTQVASSLAALRWGMARALLVAAASPFPDPRALPQLFYSASTGSALTGAPGVRIYVGTPGSYAGAAIAASWHTAVLGLVAAIAWSAALSAITVYVIKRSDF